MNNLVRTAQVFYGIGIAVPGIQQFIYADLRPVVLPPLPLWIHSPIIAYTTGLVLLAAGLCIALGKNARIVALFLGVFLFLMFTVFQPAYVLFLQPNLAYHLGLWTDPLKELALCGGAFIIAGVSVDVTNVHLSILNLLQKLIPVGRLFFCITMISFGIDHFFYTEFVAALLPVWFPDHQFWTYFAGVALIGAGVAIVLEIKLRRVSSLLSLMLFLWVILLHIPRAITDPYIAKGNEITSVFEALAFSGIALAVSCTHRSKTSKTTIPFFKTVLQYEKDNQH